MWFILQSLPDSVRIWDRASSEFVPFAPYFPFRSINMKSYDHYKCGSLAIAKETIDWLYAMGHPALAILKLEDE